MMFTNALVLPASFAAAAAAVLWQTSSAQMHHYLCDELWHGNARDVVHLGFPTLHVGRRGHEESGKKKKKKKR
jgi:hypothetical protein